MADQLYNQYELDYQPSADGIGDSTQQTSTQNSSNPANQPYQSGNDSSNLSSRVESLEKYVDDLKNTAVRQNSNAVLNNLDVKERITAWFGKIGGWLIENGKLSTNKIEIDSNNSRIRSTNYQTGTRGFTIQDDLVEAENAIIRGTIRGGTFAYDKVNAIGGQMLVCNADTLAEDMGVLDNSVLITKGDTTFAVNDILLMRNTVGAGVVEEWLRVTAVSGTTYTVTRDLAGSFTANENPGWRAGTPVVKQGVSNGTDTYSGGWLRLIGEGTNSPYYSVFQRTGLAYNGFTETCRLGNLNGFLGYTSDLYGIALGDSVQNLKYEPTNGLSITGGFSLDWFNNIMHIGSYDDGFTETIAGSDTLTRSLLVTSFQKVGNGTGGLMSPSLGTGYDWDDSYMFSCSVKTGNAGQTQPNFFGLCENHDPTTQRHVGFIMSGTTLSASMADGTTQETASITGITLTNMNNYRIYWSAGVGAYFYVNNILQATLTTNKPSGSTTPPKIVFGSIISNAQNSEVLTFNNNYTLSIK